MLTMPAEDQYSALTLVRQACNGDAASYRELFRAHCIGVHRIAYRLLGPSADIDDVVQTVFVEAFRSLASFRGDARFSTWLARIAVRVVMRSTTRRPASWLSLEDVAVAETGPGPSEVAEEEEGVRHLNQLLARLRPKKRVAFVLHVLEGYSAAEAAEMLGVSVAAVKLRVYEARRELASLAARDPWFAEVLSRREAP
jgi:RNA polymerase sigma-70 factor, ECF subfamily